MKEESFWHMSFYYLRKSKDLFIQMKGRFIVIEGLDGSGKSTQTALLQEALNVGGLKAEYIHFPRTDIESPFYGPMLRKFLKGELGSIDEVDPYFVALLFAGDRRNAISWISERLDAGIWVIADRYVLSNIAFQGAKLKQINEKKKLASWILNLEFGHFELPKPDLTLFLHMPISFTKTQLNSQRKGDDRSYLDGERDIHEADFSFQQKVYEMYLMMLKMKEADLFDLQIKKTSAGIPSSKEIQKQILAILQNLVTNQCQI